MNTTNESISFPKLCLSCGKLVDIENETISNAIYHALKAADKPDRLLALNLSDKIMKRIALCKKSVQVISVDELHDIAEFVLVESSLFKAAQEYSNLRRNLFLN